MEEQQKTVEKKSKTKWIVGVIFVAIIVGIFFLTTTSKERIERIEVLTDGPFLGTEGAPVTIVEFSDFECPFCKRHYFQTFPQLYDNYIVTGKVKYVYKHFPIPQHVYANILAKGSVCADKQGYFWRTHDLIFELEEPSDVSLVSAIRNSSELSEMNFTEWAECFNSYGEVYVKIQKDYDDGQAIGVSATPTFFINGRKFVGAQPYSEFVKIIEEELDNAGR